MKILKYLFLLLLFVQTANAQPVSGSNVKIWDGTDIALVTPGKALLTDGSATTQPISGTVTCNAGTNLNTSALATSANQTTIIGHLDGVEGLLGTIDADTGGILTSVQILDNIVSGSEAQVDIVASLPAGTNNIGDVDLASAIPAGTNNIGDVDLASAIPAGTNNIGDVDVLTLPAITGTVTCNAGTNLNTSALATSAIQTTQSGYLDGIEGLLGTIDADTGNISLNTADAASYLSSIAATVHGQASTATFGIMAMGSDGTDARRIKTDTAGELQIDILSSALPTGASTAAHQVTEHGYVDGLEALIGTTNTNTGAATTALQLLDNAVAGNELQVDVLTLPALPAGTNNIGDVDVLSLPALPAGTNNIGDVDVLTLPAITGTVTCNAGTNLNTSALATSANQTTEITSLQLLDDAITTTGSAVTAKGVLMTGTDGTNARGLKTDASGEAQIDVLTLPAIPAGTNNIGDVDVLTLPALVAGTANIGDVDIASAIPAGTNNIGDVDIASAIPAGTNNIGDVDVLTLPAITGTVTCNAGTNLNTSALATSANQTTEITSLQLLDDAITTTGSAVTTKGVLMTGTDGTNARGLKTDSSGEAQIDVLTLPALVAGTANIGDVDVLTLPALVAGTANIGDVDVLTLPAIPAGTNNIGDVDVLTLPAIPAGNNNIGDVDAIQSGTWTVQPGNTPNTTAWLQRLVAGTGGGWTPFKSLDLDETEEEIKSTAGQIGWYMIANRSAAERFVKFYNATAATVVVGTTVPIYTIPLAAGEKANVSTDAGLEFTTAITMACTTGIADNDTGAPAANDCVVNIGFK